ncbi:MAG TPA: gluconokinase [Caulobacteraceae bacterium]|nr:gluconokinase [Caulobacteraceae bacterium]
MSGEARVLAVMGVSGVGKTTLAKALAERLGWPFKEGDELHPAANVAKMKAGHPLNDADRKPWLDAVGAWIDAWLAAGQSGVITCSALKRAYRDQLEFGRPQLTFVFIHLSEAETARRIEGREGHFMPPSLLASQFADLQPPDDDEPVAVVDGAEPIPAQVAAVVAFLGVVQPSV